jgi:hypothetical protein
MEPKKIRVREVGGRHECEPTETHVTGGERIIWGGDSDIVFPDSPFVEGSGPFKPGSGSTVKPRTELHNKTYQGKVRKDGKDLELHGKIFVD